MTASRKSAARRHRPEVVIVGRGLRGFQPSSGGGRRQRLRIERARERRSSKADIIVDPHKNSTR